MLHNKKNIIGSIKKLGAAIGFTFIILSAIGAFVAPLIVIYGAYKRQIPLDLDMAVWGAFGDFISGISGTWISFITLIMVWVTFIWQRRELQDQKELNARQTTVMERQAFEQTYFSWVAILKNIPLDIDADSMFKDFREGPRSYFNSVLGYARNNKMDDNYQSQLDQHIRSFIEAIPEIYAYNKKEGLKDSWIEQNLKNLEAIVTFVDRTDKYPTLPEEKSIYFNILTAQYSNSQRYILGLEALVAELNIVKILAEYKFFDFNEKFPIGQILERRLQGTLSYEFVEATITRLNDRATGKAESVVPPSA